MESGQRSIFPAKHWARLLIATSLALAIALLAVALFARPALAAPSATLASPSFEEEEFESEEGWEDEDEDEFEEEDEEFGTTGPLLFPSECLLHSVAAEVTASTNRDLVSLAIHYTATTPTNVAVDYWLKGGKGSLHLAQSKRHFGAQGIFRDSEHLSEHAMAKVRAARTFIVQLDIPAAPDYCSRYSTQRLTVKRTSGSQATWSRAN